MVFSENTKTEIQIRKFKAKTILLFFIVITITVGVVSFVITRKSSNAMQNKVVNLVAQGNRQQINNVNSYLGKIEDMAALLFSDELYYEIRLSIHLKSFRLRRQSRIDWMILVFWRISLTLESCMQMILRSAGYRIQRYSYFQMEDYSLILIVISIIQRQDPGGFLTIVNVMTGFII